MSRPAKYDYDALERQYITGDMSLRELCRLNGIDTWSTVAEQAKKREWDKRRDEYRAIARQHEMEVLAGRRAQKLEQLTDDLVDTIHAAVLQYVAGLQDRTVQLPDGTYQVIPATPVVTSDLVKLIDKVQLLRGLPTSREVKLGLGLDLHGNVTDPSQLPPELLRELAAAARAGGAGTGAGGQSPIPRVEGPRKVN